MKERRGHWYLLTGFIIGVTLGIVYAWKINPVKYENTLPASLRADFKDQYRELIAVAYTANKSLERAKVRLAQLGDPDPKQTLAIQAQHSLAAKNPRPEAYALGQLAIALSQAESGGSPPSQGGSPVPKHTSLPASTLANPTLTVLPLRSTETLSPAVTLTQGIKPTASAPILSVTLFPTQTYTPTPGSPFSLENIQLVCEQIRAQPLIMIQTLDAADQPVPGVEIIVTWENGEDRFYTGLKPELGLGYADFAMTPSVVYTVRLGDEGIPESGITPKECDSPSGTRYWGSWRLVFIQK